MEGRPINRGNKAEFPNYCGVVWTLPKRKCHDVNGNENINKKKFNDQNIGYACAYIL